MSMDNYDPHHLESCTTRTDDVYWEILATLPNIPFPYKLHQMLDNGAKDKQLEAIVSWLPNKCSFQVHDQDAFVKQVLPRYFFKITKYNSFIRQLHSYGFERISRGGYFHENLIRGEPRYCKYITRHDVRSTGVKTGDLSVIAEGGECHKVQANMAIQEQAPPAVLSKLNKNIDSPEDNDGDLVMFYGKHFYFVDAIGGHGPHQVSLPAPVAHAFVKLQPMSTKNQSSCNKEFVEQNPPPFYKARTPKEASALLKRILGGRV
jgi:hypothetical protein